MSSARGGRGGARGRGTITPAQNGSKRTPREGFQRGNMLAGAPRGPSVRGSATRGIMNARKPMVKRDASQLALHAPAISLQGQAGHNMYGGTPQDRFQNLKKAREHERSIAIEQGFLADPDRPRTLAEAITPVGTCPDMCAEFERVERIVQKDVWQAETAEDDSPAEERMVKKFRRAAAGLDEQLPSDLRPPSVLKKTIEYLFDDVIGSAESLGTVHHFVWDRTRAVRNDFSIQQITKPGDVEIAMECYERIARFHILSLHQFAVPEKPYDKYDWYQEREQLDRTLLSLMQYYDDNRGRISSQNEAEFRAYCIIFQIQDPTPDLEERVNSWAEDVKINARVQAALELYAAASNTVDSQGPLKPRTTHPVARGDWHDFFTTVESQRVSYLMACVAEIYFNLVRKQTLTAIWRAFRRQGSTADVTDFTVEYLTDLLKFDDPYQTEEFCEHFSLIFKDGTQASGGDMFLDLNALQGKTFPEAAQALPLQTFSECLVETKRAYRTFPAIIRGLNIKQAQDRGLIDDTKDTEDQDFSMDDDGESLFVPEGPKSHNATNGTAPKTLGGSSVFSTSKSAIQPAAISNPFDQKAVSSPFENKATPSPFGSNGNSSPLEQKAASTTPFAFKPTASPFQIKPATSPFAQMSNTSPFQQSPVTKPFGQKSASNPFAQTAISDAFSIKPSSVTSTADSDSKSSTPNSNPFAPGKATTFSQGETNTLQAFPQFGSTPFQASPFNEETSGLHKTVNVVPAEPQSQSIFKPKPVEGKTSSIFQPESAPQVSADQSSSSPSIFNLGNSTVSKPVVTLDKHANPFTFLSSPQNPSSAGGPFSVEKATSKNNSTGSSVLDKQQHTPFSLAKPTSSIDKYTDQSSSSRAASSLFSEISPSLTGQADSSPGLFGTSSSKLTSKLAKDSAKGPSKPFFSITPSTLAQGQDQTLTPSATTPNQTTLSPEQMVPAAVSHAKKVTQPKKPSPLSKSFAAPSDGQSQALPAQDTQTNEQRRPNFVGKAVSQQPPLANPRADFEQNLQRLAEEVVLDIRRGLIKQFVEHHAKGVIDSVFDQVSTEYENKIADEFRREKLAIRYGRKWRDICWRLRLMRHGKAKREKRRNARKTRESYEVKKELRSKSAVDDFLKMSYSGKTDGARRSTHATVLSKAIPRSHVSRPDVNPQSDSLVLGDHHAKRAQDQASTSHRSGIQSSRSVGASGKERKSTMLPPTSSINQRSHFLGFGLSNGRLGKSTPVAATRSTYFRMKAMGINPNGPDQASPNVKKRPREDDDSESAITSPPQKKSRTPPKDVPPETTSRPRSESIQSRASIISFTSAPYSSTSSRPLSRAEQADEALFARARAARKALTGRTGRRPDPEQEDVHGAGSASVLESASMQRARAEARIRPSQSAATDDSASAWGQPPDVPAYRLRESRFVPREDYHKAVAKARENVEKKFRPSGSLNTQIVSGLEKVQQPQVSSQDSSYTVRQSEGQEPPAPGFLPSELLQESFASFDQAQDFSQPVKPLSFTPSQDKSTDDRPLERQVDFSFPRLEQPTFESMQHEEDESADLNLAGVQYPDLGSVQQASKEAAMFGDDFVNNTAAFDYSPELQPNQSWTDHAPTDSSMEAPVSFNKHDQEDLPEVSMNDQSSADVQIDPLLLGQQPEYEKMIEGDSQESDGPTDNDTMDEAGEFLADDEVESEDEAEEGSEGGVEVLDQEVEYKQQAFAKLGHQEQLRGSTDEEDGGSETDFGEREADFDGHEHGTGFTSRSNGLLEEEDDDLQEEFDEDEEDYDSESGSEEEQNGLQNGTSLIKGGTGASAAEAFELSD